MSEAAFADASSVTNDVVVSHPADLIAKTADEYVSTAVALSSDLKGMSELRA